MAKGRNKIAQMNYNIKDILHKLSLIEKNNKIYLKMENVTILDGIDIAG